MRTRLLLERVAQLGLLRVSRAGRRDGCSVWTKPWIVVTGVRSSCAASATKFVISSFARSRASRVSCSCSKSRTRSSAIAGHRGDRVQRAQLVCRRRRARTATSRRRTIAPVASIVSTSGCPELGPSAGGHPGARLVVEAARGEQLAVRIEDRGSPAPTSAATGPNDALGHLAPRRRQRHQTADRLLQARLLARAPEARTMPRRVDPEQEAEPRDGGEGRRQRPRRAESWSFANVVPMIAIVSDAAANASRRMRRSRRRRLAAARPPEANGDDDREQRPVDEEQR